MPEGTFEGTYLNFKQLTKDLETFGHPGCEILRVEGLTAGGTEGDRRTYNIEGTKIIIPSRSVWPGTEWEPYNNDVYVGISLNSDGEDTDNWFTFYTGASVDTRMAGSSVIENVCFHKLTVLNLDASAEPTSDILLWIFTDPFFINQVNKMLQDMTP